MRVEIRIAQQFLQLFHQGGLQMVFDVVRRIVVTLPDTR